MEEDCGAFAADCVVLSCCCQCLVLQVTLPLSSSRSLVNLPRGLRSL
ncbi:unnamed protein product [Brassica rapa subsp. trilocularis]